MISWTAASGSEITARTTKNSQSECNCSNGNYYSTGVGIRQFRVRALYRALYGGIMQYPREDCTMPRKPTVWWREEKQCYYTTIRRKKIRLASKLKDAEKAFHSLMARKSPLPRRASSRPSGTCDRFRKDSEQNKKPTTFRMHSYLLQSFCDHIGRKRVNDLRVHHVTEWVGMPKKKVKTWNQKHACSARSAVLACLNWSVEQGYISSHPLGKLKGLAQTAGTGADH